MLSYKSIIKVGELKYKAKDVSKSECIITLSVLFWHLLADLHYTCAKSWTATMKYTQPGSSCSVRAQTQILHNALQRSTEHMPKAVFLGSESQVYLLLSGCIYTCTVTAQYSKLLLSSHKLLHSTGMYRHMHAHTVQ